MFIFTCLRQAYGVAGAARHPFKVLRFNTVSLEGEVLVAELCVRSPRVAAPSAADTISPLS